MLLLHILFYLFIAVVIIQVTYFLCFLYFFSLKRSKENSKYNPPISVIICAKNEAENLKENLPHIINQKYSKFEIVLINDSSSDSTLQVMKSFASQYDTIKIVDVKSIEQFWGNKKYALTLGIKASSYDVLLFTDGDCKPSSKQWIYEMSQHFSKKSSIVLGYGAYKKRSFSILNKLIRYETLTTALQYFSYANAGLPYMGVGRNMAYRKSLFFSVGGYKDHMNTMSGDDDLFINQIADQNNTEICMLSNSFTVSTPKTTFRDWIIQKRRHISTAKFYKWKHKILLSLHYTSNLLFWLSFIVLIAYQYHWLIVLSLFSLRFILHLFTTFKAAKQLKELDLVIWVPFLELFLIVFQFCIFIANLISKPNHWK